MTAVAFALLSALVWGTADFFGGVLARRVPAVVVTAAAMPAGLLVLLAVAPWSGQADLASMLWGLGAGTAGALGVALLYAGLAIGPMNVVAPLTAVTCTALPVAAAVAMGERPSALAWAGVVLGAVAVWLVGAAADSAEDAAGSISPARRRRGVVLALIAGAGFGVFFILLDQSDPDSGAWPLVAARLAGSTVALGLAARHLRALLPGRTAPGTFGAAAGVGLLDTAANVLFLLAVRSGLLSLVSVLVALYPAATVLLARLVHHERTTTPQKIGLLVAAAAVTLITAGSTS